MRIENIPSGTMDPIVAREVVIASLFTRSDTYIINDGSNITIYAKMNEYDYDYEYAVIAKIEKSDEYIYPSGDACWAISSSASYNMIAAALIREDPYNNLMIVDDNIIRLKTASSMLRLSDMLGYNMLSLSTRSAPNMYKSLNMDADIHATVDTRCVESLIEMILPINKHITIQCNSNDLIMMASISNNFIDSSGVSLVKAHILNIKKPCSLRTVNALRIPTFLQEVPEERICVKMIDGEILMLSSHEGNVTRAYKITRVKEIDNG